MKVVNVILSVVILVLAIASAVLSYILFERRSQLIAGWDKYAVTVSDTAKILDQKNSDKISTKLNRARLDHRNIGKIDPLLPELTKRAKALIAERDAYAVAFRRIGVMVDAANIPTDAALCDLDSFDRAKNTIVGAVNDSINKRDTVYNRIASAFERELKARIDVDSLRKGNVSAIAPAENALRRNSERLAFYERNFQIIGRTAGSPSFNNSENSYKGSVAAVTTAVKTQDSNLRQTRSDLAAANAEINRQKSIVSQREAEIATQKAVIADRNALISGYRRALGLEVVGEKDTPWKDGSAEVRSVWVGKVTAVDKDYGYIVINLGKDTAVKQTLGKKTLDVRVMPEKDMAMVVARGDMAEGADFVAKVNLVEIGANESTANIPAGSKIRVGDIVYVAMP